MLSSIAIALSPLRNLQASAAMAETKKRKERSETNRGREKSKAKKKTSKYKSSNSKSQRKKTGPHLPSSLLKELDRVIPPALDSDEDIDSGGSDDNGERELFVNDVYEYEEERAEEESKKNKRYDAGSVEKLEYELPDELSDDFKVTASRFLFFSI